MNEEVKPKLKASAYKSKLKPIWCPGCGHFGVLSAITKALAYLSIPNEKVALVSGIGCSSRVPAYVDVFGFHGLVRSWFVLSGSTLLSVVKPWLGTRGISWPVRSLPASSAARSH